MNNIESIFKEKSMGLKVEPSGSAWDRLQTNLSTPPVKRLHPRYWVMAACVTGLILTGSIIMYFNNNRPASFPYETTTLDFSNLDYGDAISKINTLNDAYVKLGIK